MISFIFIYLSNIPNRLEVNASVIFKHCFQTFFLLLQLWRWLLLSFDARWKRFLRMFCAHFMNVYRFDSLHQIYQANIHHAPLQFMVTIEYLPFSSKLEGVFWIVLWTGLFIGKLARWVIGFGSGGRRSLLCPCKFVLFLEFHQLYFGILFYGF
jgi:hypothetical protein